ncbi:unnamed protein product [Anisakis simplex]|uniref:Uncharacterized protein n=1 Tax=Anisakis simplex TaxID=6269 RepID=A0A0M3JZ84_ANISI|nr:unnamed protein product [Anisakis simplex]
MVRPRLRYFGCTVLYVLFLCAAIQSGASVQASHQTIAIVKNDTNHSSRSLINSERIATNHSSTLSSMKLQPNFVTWLERGHQSKGINSEFRSWKRTRQNLSLNATSAKLPSQSRRDTKDVKLLRRQRDIMNSRQTARPIGLSAAEEEELLERFRMMLMSSSITASALAVICLLIALRIVCFERMHINRRLILLNEKVNALETRLGSRQLPESLQLKLCQVIGISYERIKEERQKAAQDIANDERMLMNEMVNETTASLYDTMRGIEGNVFDRKAERMIAEAADKYEFLGEPLNEAAKKNVLSSDNGYECYGGGVQQVDAEKKSSKESVDEKAGNKVSKQKVSNVVFDTKNSTERCVDKKKTPTVCGINETVGFKPSKEDAQTHNDQIRAPTTGGIAATNDPNYATLNRMDNDQVFKVKRTQTEHEFSNQAPLPEIKQPLVGGIADEGDPHYETLHGIDNTKVFQKK